MMLRTGYFEKYIKYTWKVSKYGAGEGRRKRFRKVVWGMKKNYIVSRGEEYPTHNR
jgi:hypothetical protein